jgi:hypothetical protein
MTGEQISSGKAQYFDGTSSARHEVTIEAVPKALRILASDGTLIVAR